MLEGADMLEGGDMLEGMHLDCRAERDEGVSSLAIQIGFV
jgi:hypothetical protein